MVALSSMGGVTAICVLFFVIFGIMGLTVGVGAAPFAWLHLCSHVADPRLRLVDLAVARRGAAARASLA